MPPTLHALLLALTIMATPVFSVAQEADIESLLEQIADGREVNISEGENLKDAIEVLRTEPVDINADASIRLLEAGVISHLEHQALTAYIEVHGALVSLYELQAVPFFTLELINTILPLITLGDGSEDVGTRLSLTNASHRLLMRWRQNLERSAGYLPRNGTTSYLGHPAALFLRYQYQSSDVRIGLLAEKDPGEPLFGPYVRTGFDHIGFYISAGPINKYIRQVTLGDFSITLGHGLIHQSGYSVGKNSQTVMLLRGANTLTPTRTARESHGLRGVAALLSAGPKINIKVFASHVKRDATLSPDSASHSPTGLVISSMRNTGLHRTYSEIATKRAARHVIVGGDVSIKIKKLNTSINIIHHKFEYPLQRPKEPYRQLRFFGKSMTNASLSYTGVIRNCFLFGEVSRGPGNVIAMTQGAMVSLNRKIRVALYGRHLPAGYQHHGARTLSENSRAENETGVYLGTEIEFKKGFRINAYTDIWKNPGPTFQFDHPGHGTEQLLRIGSYKRHKLEVYIQLKSQRKLRNHLEGKVNIPSSEQRSTARLHINRKINKSLELRTRLELSLYILKQAMERAQGTLVYQDVIFKPIGGRFGFTSRIAVFRIPSYNARIYAYENDLTQSFSIPAYYGIGSRAYLNFKYMATKGLTIEFRISQTWLKDRQTIGSGLDELAGNKRTTLKAQLRYAF